MQQLTRKQSLHAEQQGATNVTSIEAATALIVRNGPTRRLFM